MADTISNMLRMRDSHMSERIEEFYAAVGAECPALIEPLAGKRQFAMSVVETGIGKESGETWDAVVIGTICGFNKLHLRGTPGATAKLILFTDLGKKVTGWVCARQLEDIASQGVVCHFKTVPTGIGKVACREFSNLDIAI